MMNRKGKTELIASLVVALVAVVGLVGVYSGMNSSSPSGLAQSHSADEWSNSIDLGNLCGSCVAASLRGEALPSDCSRMTSEGPLFQLQDNNAKDKCCARGCAVVKGGDRCGTICGNTASHPERYGGNPYSS